MRPAPLPPARRSHTCRSAASCSRARTTSLACRTSGTARASATSYVMPSAPSPRPLGRPVPTTAAPLLAPDRRDGILGPAAAVAPERVIAVQVHVHRPAPLAHLERQLCLAHVPTSSSSSTDVGCRGGAAGGFHPDGYSIPANSSGRITRYSLVNSVAYASGSARSSSDRVK